MSEEKTEDNNETAKPGNGFLSDLTDDRPKGDWDSKYDINAQKGIRWEKKYIIILLVCCLVIPLIFGIVSNRCFWGFTCDFDNLKKYIFAWFGGTLGGTLFSLKWLVHSVAKNTWNIDRRMWRIFTPHLSGVLAFIIILLVNSEIFKLIDIKTLSIHKCYGIGFLVGYFSDNAIGKLTEIAQVLFGSSISQRK